MSNKERFNQCLYFAISNLVYMLFLEKMHKSTNGVYPRYIVISRANLSHFLSDKSYLYDHIINHISEDIRNHPLYQNHKHMNCFDDIDDEFINSIPSYIQQKKLLTISNIISIKAEIGENPYIVEDHELMFPSDLSDDYYEWIVKQTILDFILYYFIYTKDVKLRQFNRHNCIILREDEVLWITHNKAIHGIHITYDDFDTDSDVIKLVKFITSTNKTDGVISTGMSNVAGVYTILTHSRE